MDFRSNGRRPPYFGVHSVVNNESLSMTRDFEKAVAYQKRLQSKRTRQLGLALVSKLEERGYAISDDEVENIQIHMKKRKKIGPESHPEGPLHSTEAISLKLQRLGYLNLHDVFRDAFRLYRFIIFNGSSEQRKTAEDAIEVIEKASNNNALKKEFRVCCFDPKWNPPHPIACNAVNCDLLIRHGALHYEVQLDSKESVHVCLNCYKKYDSTIRVKISKFLSNHTTECIHTNIEKSTFVRQQCGRATADEPTVVCAFCFMSHHKMCVKYEDFNWETGFRRYNKDFTSKFNPVYICRHCQKLMSTNSPTAFFQGRLFTVDCIQHTKLSEYIERKLQNFIYGICVSKGQLLPSVVKVREVHSRKRRFSALPKMKAEYAMHNKPTEFEYTERSIMLFQCESPNSQTEAETAVFNLIVQEYPSSGIIYISYIDSGVRRFVPGMTKVLIWACPPNPGDEYVFFGRPVDQPLITGLHLNRWYTDLLKLAIELGVVDHYEQVGPSNPNIYKNYLDIPYIFGDFWQQKLEEIVTVHEAETALWNGENENGTEEDVQRYKKRKVSHCLKKGMPLTIQERVGKVIAEDCKDELFICNLKGSEKSLQKSKKPPLDVKCQFMGSRDPWMLACRRNAFDFSNPRRGAYATKYMIAHMAKESLSTKCSDCDSVITKGVYCYVCNDAYYCKNCRNRHIHQLYFHRFVVPIVEPVHERNADDVLLRALQHLTIEANHLTTYAHEANIVGTKPKNPLHRFGHDLATVQKRHMRALNSEDDLHDPLTCRLCLRVWLPYERHQHHFCQGKDCNVPSCSHKPPAPQEKIAVKSRVVPVIPPRRTISQYQLKRFPLFRGYSPFNNASVGFGGFGRTRFHVHPLNGMRHIPQPPAPPPPLAKNIFA